MRKINKTSMARLGTTVAAVLCTLGALGPGAGAAAPTQADVATDWTTAGPGGASGTVLGTAVSLSGTHVWGPPQSTVDGTSTLFATSAFSPLLARSDALQISGGPDRAYSYTLDFAGSAVTDPILDLGSLGSRIDFAAGTQVTRLSGDAAFTVSGSTVSGTASNTIGASGLSDSSGSIRLTGTFSKLTFTAKTNYVGPEDGIMVQLVLQPQFTDWSAVGTNTATGTLRDVPVSLSGTHVWSPPQSTLDGSAALFATSVFSPSLARSDALQISGGPDRPYTYTLDFAGRSVTDPILHLGSLGSRIDFPAGTQVKRVSGDGAFTVSGTTVSGTASNTIGASGMSDSSGSIRLVGSFTKITFSAKTNYVGPEDGIMVQLGANLPG